MKQLKSLTSFRKTEYFINYSLKKKKARIFTDSPLTYSYNILSINIRQKKVITVNIL